MLLWVKRTESQLLSTQAWYALLLGGIMWLLIYYEQTEPEKTSMKLSEVMGR